jgi:hypothetical protein
MSNQYIWEFLHETLCQGLIQQHDDVFFQQVHYVGVYKDMRDEIEWKCEIWYSIETKFFHQFEVF